MIRQAIETRYLPATNTRPARIGARAQAGRIAIPWDHGLNQEDNHRRAAEQFAERMGWTGRLVGGGLPGASFVWVFAPD